MKTTTQRSRAAASLKSTAVILGACLGPVANAQAEALAFNGELIVSALTTDGRPLREVQSRPLSAAGQAGAAQAASGAPALSLEQLRLASQIAGIYTPPVDCPPGVACKPSPEFIPIEKVEEPYASSDLSSLYRVATDDPAQLARTAAALSEVSGYQVTPNYIRQPTQLQDPESSLQWGFQPRNVSMGGADFRSAWRRTTGRRSVVVAVLDTGLSRMHPEFAGNTVNGIDVIAHPARSGDGDGVDLDASDPGDFVSSFDQNLLFFGFDMRCPQSSSSWHGTHVAGTIAARANGVFGTGGAPDVRIMPIRVLGKCGGNDWEIQRGISWAIGLPVQGLPLNPNPARIVNLSLGGAAPCTPAYRQLFAEAKRRGVVVIAAAGNDNRDAAFYAPAGCPDVITVHAHDRNGFRMQRSNFGSVVNISAPGVDILSASDFGTAFPIGSSSSYSTGTSMAAPHVAAAVALLLSERPQLTVDEVWSLLQRSAAPFYPGSGCASGEFRAGQCGVGMLDADRLLAVAGVPVVGASPPPPPSPTPTPTPQPVPPVTPPPSDTRGGGAMSGWWILGLGLAAFLLRVADRRGARPTFSGR